MYCTLYLLIPNSWFIPPPPPYPFRKLEFVFHVCKSVSVWTWRRERLPTPVFWPGELHGLYSSWGRKESDTTEWLALSFHSMTGSLYDNISAVSKEQGANILMSHVQLCRPCDCTCVLWARRPHWMHKIYNFEIQECDRVRQFWAGCGSVGDVSGAWLASAPLWPSLWT